jgi:nitroimidazol reductase NimA-like FMN-containing flavoprotein (pyridoxamine 5'-phosphate oxidase superfamily)
MNLVDLASSIEVISYEECRELLGTERIGRLAVVVDGRPEIFPVNYGLDGDGVLVRSDRGLKVSAALVGEVAFEVDSIDLDEHSGWSVVVHGRAEDISHFDGPVLRARADVPWTGPKDSLIRIAMTWVTGRRVVAHEPKP